VYSVLKLCLQQTVTVYTVLRLCFQESVYSVLTPFLKRGSKELAGWNATILNPCLQKAVYTIYTVLTPFLKRGSKELADCRDVHHRLILQLVSRKMHMSNK
jgi:hypothetical protein